MNAAAAESRGSGQVHNQQLVTPYTRRTTQDRDEAEKVITELYLPNRIDLSGHGGPLDMEVTGLQLGALTAGRLTYGRRVRLRTADAPLGAVTWPSGHPRRSASEPNPWPGSGCSSSL